MDTLAVKNLTFCYPGGEKPALNDVSFCVQSGEFVTLCGLSGSGKTTLSNLITGTYPPGRGEILWDGTDISHTGQPIMEKQFAVVA